MPFLTVLEKGGAKRYKFTGGSVVIGRGADCGIKLADAGASERHCRIAKTPEGFKLIDLSGGAGTILNGAQVKQHLLKHGDKISLGETKLVFEEQVTAKVPKAQSGTAKSETASPRATGRRSTKKTGAVRATGRLSRTQQFKKKAERKRINPLVVVLVLAVLIVAGLFYIIFSGGKDETQKIINQYTNLIQKARQDMDEGKLEEAGTSVEKALEILRPLEREKKRRHVRDANAFLKEIDRLLEAEKEAKKKTDSLEKRWESLRSKIEKDPNNAQLHSNLNYLLRKVREAKERFAESRQASRLVKMEKEMVKVPPPKGPVRWPEYREKHVEPLLRQNPSQYSAALDKISEFLRDPPDDRDREDAENRKLDIDGYAASECRRLYGNDPAGPRVTSRIEEMGKEHAREFFKKEKERYRGTPAEKTIDDILKSF